MGLWDTLMQAFGRKATQKAGEFAAKEAARQAVKKVEAIGDDFLDAAEQELQRKQAESDAQREALGVELPEVNVDVPDVGEPEATSEPDPNRWDYNDGLSAAENVALAGVEKGAGARRAKEKADAEASAKAELEALKKQLRGD